MTWLLGRKTGEGWRYRNGYMSHLVPWREATRFRTPYEAEAHELRAWDSTGIRIISLDEARALEIMEGM